MACRLLERSNKLRDSIIVESNAQRSRTSQSYPTTEDIMFMHILDYIGALSCIRADQRKKTLNNCRTDNGENEQASAVSVRKTLMLMKKIKLMRKKLMLLQ
jgi:hypothetical protein